MSHSNKLFCIEPYGNKPSGVVIASTVGRRNSDRIAMTTDLGRRIIVFPEATLQNKAAKANITIPVIPWLNPDVHARTPEMRSQLLAEYPDLPKQSQNRANVPGELDRVLAQIRGRELPADANACLDKIYNRRGAIDKDLCNISVAGLLCIIWSDCIIPRLKDTFPFFVNTLCDMGTTCVQGDSHRLYATYVALYRDEIECMKLKTQKFVC